MVAMGAAYTKSMGTDVYSANYRPLLDTIAKGESNGNYNAHFGNASNTAVVFTKMTVGDVLKWQNDFVAQGSPSNAVGKYQIIQPTLEGLVGQLQIPLSARFDEALQDKLALALLERRGVNEYLQNQLSHQQFAANLAMEWAALPKMTGDNPEQSFYAGDGLNKVQVTTDEIYSALALLRSSVE